MRAAAMLAMVLAASSALVVEVGGAALAQDSGQNEALASITGALSKAAEDVEKIIDWPKAVVQDAYANRDTNKAKDAAVVQQAKDNGVSMCGLLPCPGTNLPAASTVAGTSTQQLQPTPQQKLDQAAPVEQSAPIEQTIPQAVPAASSKTPKSGINMIAELNQWIDAAAGTHPTIGSPKSLHLRDAGTEQDGAPAQHANEGPGAQPAAKKVGASGSLNPQDPLVAMSKTATALSDSVASAASIVASAITAVDDMKTDAKAASAPPPESKPASGAEAASTSKPGSVLPLTAPDPSILSPYASTVDVSPSSSNSEAAVSTTEVAAKASTTDSTAPKGKELGIPTEQLMMMTPEQIREAVVAASPPGAFSEQDLAGLDGLSKLSLYCCPICADPCPGTRGADPRSAP